MLKLSNIGIVARTFTFDIDELELSSNDRIP